MAYTGTTADVIGLTSLPMQIRYNFLIFCMWVRFIDMGSAVRYHPLKIKLLLYVCPTQGLHDCAQQSEPSRGHSSVFEIL